MGAPNILGQIAKLVILLRLPDSFCSKRLLIL